MQTPADHRHWTGDKMVPGGEADAAKAFAEACHESGLDVVAITDHNFLSRDFIPFIQSALKDIEDGSGHKITLFPGFEFEAAGVGKGVHVLCIFDPSSDLAQVDSILTECGVRFPRLSERNELEKSDNNLKKILHIVQNKHSGLVILPHAMSDDGIFDNDRISEWLQQDQFINPELLAVEVPKPIPSMNNAFQKLFRSGSDCMEDWKRVRPIATLMSSDNKTLIDKDADGRPKPNSIGFRYSWIKMSEPSIESLRQAFLDHDSRVILPTDVTSDIHPSNRIRQARIRKISIKNVAFLADQEIHFSPNMNCVIGGRGSGKSTLLEYLRIMFRKDSGEDIDDDTRGRIERIRDTLNSGEAEIEVSWESAERVQDNLVLQDGTPSVRDRDLSDPDTFFNNLPIRFYSQQQLNRLTESTGEDGVFQAQRLLDLIDGFNKNALEDLHERERKLRIDISDSFNNRRMIESFSSEVKRLQQELDELDRQWKARSEIQEDARRHQLLKAEARYIEALYGAQGRQFSDVAALAEEVASLHTAFDVEDSPHGGQLRSLDEKVKSAKDSLARSITAAVEQFHEKVEGFKASDENWDAMVERQNGADDDFQTACSSKGLTPDDVGHLQETAQARSRKQEEMDRTKEEIERLTGIGTDPENLIGQLHDIWKEQFENRMEAANRANQLAVLNEEDQRFIEISAKYQQDHESFRHLWRGLAPSDGRTRLGKNWEELGETLFQLFTSQNEAGSPWQVLQSKLAGGYESLKDVFDEMSEDLFNHLSENRERWEKLRCSRVRDVVDMRLFRQNGSLAGSISDGSLSDGQRNTAALALLLAQEGGPLIIDQPEDELDSNFVFRELIPMLRSVKAKRQIIMATHNAN
ncbi:MAG: AAA family ATPase, partial [Candidatus Omnitrophica bacterium]|nr:AAA family ATPase [Candidatus Omnitrophota bacterium]